MLAERTYPLFMLGRWDEAPRHDRADPGADALGRDVLSLSSRRSRSISSAANRPRRSVFSLFSRLEESTDVQERSASSARPPHSSARGSSA